MSVAQAVALASYRITGPEHKHKRTSVIVTTDLLCVLCSEILQTVTQSYNAVGKVSLRSSAFFVALTNYIPQA